MKLKFRLGFIALLTLVLFAACQQTETAPTISITAPSNGATVEDSAVTVEGTVNDAVTSVSYELNGTAGDAADVTFDDAADTFTIAVTDLNEGSNAIVVTAQNDAGDTATDTVTVTFSPPAETGNLRVLHGSPDAPSVDVLVDSSAVLTGVPYKTGSGYLEVEAGARNVKVTAAGDASTVVIDEDVVIEADSFYTVIAANTLANIEALVLEDDRSAPASGELKLRVVHGSPSAGNVDIYVTAPDGPLVAPALSNVAFKDVGPYLEVSAGDYRVRITPAGESNVVYDSNTLPLSAGAILTVVALDSADAASDSPVTLVALTGDDANPSFEIPHDPPLTGIVYGYVVNRKAGTAVAGTTVTVEANGATATTDANGYYEVMAPVGDATLVFTQDDYAEARVEGIDVVEGEAVQYDTIQAQAYDPNTPASAPQVTVSLQDGATAEVSEESNTFTFNVSITVADTDVLQPYFTTAGLSQSRGTSGYLNATVAGTIVGGNETELTAELAALGFDGPTTLHVVVYDTNYNRTEIIRDITVNSLVSAATPTMPTDVFASAVTFGSTATFGVLSIENAPSAREMLDAIESGDVAALRTQAEQMQGDGISTQGFLDEVVTWVDITFAYDYDPTAADLGLPSAFEIYRQLGDGDFVLIGRISPFDVVSDESDTQVFVTYRDATPALTAGVEATYRVDAVTGAARESSMTASTTPLGAFDVTGVYPADGDDFVPVSPTYQISYEGTADDVLIGVVVTDRNHSQGNFAEWVFGVFTSGIDGAAPGLTVTPEGATIPHNITGTASTEALQPYHAYDWTPIAATISLDEEGNRTAISVGADFYGFLLPFGVEDAPYNTFVTGDGSY
ncbi:MAG: DUF4397 domain-containing protein [Trueperaceae bacterium]|nr:DUF4397 domain-containing protein [Trueperaceae bacterium]